MNITTTNRTPLFDEVLVQDTVLEHYTAAREAFGELLDQLDRSCDAMRSKAGHRCIWHINSTAFGGGVAEMLPHHVCLQRELGIDVRWLVFKPQAAVFFRFTKGLHNALHGIHAPNLDALAPHYLAPSEQAAAELARIIGPGDILIVHDPQPLGAVAAFLRSHPHAAIWRCHVGYPGRLPAVDEARRFLREHLHPFQRIVLSDQAYAFDAGRPIDIIQPSISPFSRKNRFYLEPPGATLEQSVSLIGDDGQSQPSFRELLASRYFLHVSRWDGLKGIDRLIAAFDRFARTADGDAQDIRLVIAGPDPLAVADDPEDRTYFEQYAALCAQLPKQVRRRLHLACVSMTDIDANAEVIGRLQQNAYAVFQLSREEGFGLTTTEALLRGKPVIVSSAFGLKRQVIDGYNGVVLAPPDIEAKAAQMMERLATAYEDFEQMATTARQNTLLRSTQLAQIPKWHDSIRAALASFERKMRRAAPRTA
jgi:trehalose synthase